MRRLASSAALVTLFFMPTLLAYYPSTVVAQQELVGEQTTVLLEPLRDNGTVDYAKALNQKRGKEVAATDNVVAGILAFSPDFMLSPNEYKQRFVKELGLADVPNFIRLDEPELFLRTQFSEEPAAEAKIELASFEIYRPWTAQQYPHLAVFLAEKEELLNKMIAASQRPQYFHPLLSDRATDAEGFETIMTCLLPVTSDIRKIARTLSVLANYQIASGDIDGAIESTKSVRRLGWHCHQGLTMIELVVGTAIQKMAFNCELNLLESKKMTIAQLADYQAFLNTRPQANLVRIVNESERYMQLDIVQITGAEGLDYLGQLSGEHGSGKSFLSQVISKSIDYKQVLRLCNDNYDEMVAALEMDSFAEQARGLDKVIEKLEKLERNLGKDPDSVRTREGRSRYLANIFITMLTPAVPQVHIELSRQQVNEDLMMAAMAIEGFRTRQGKYPSKIEEIVPEYIHKLPQCRLGNRAFQYRILGEGFVIYSFGFDNEDHDGVIYDELAPADYSNIPTRSGDLRVAVGMPFRPASDSIAGKQNKRKARLRERIISGQGPEKRTRKRVR